MDLGELKSVACRAIDRRGGAIVRISERLMRRPETGFKERYAAARVVREFERLGLATSAGHALTGVVGRLETGRSGPVVAVLGELDALIVPGHPLADRRTGAAHACGHHAQVAAMIGAAIGLRAVAEQLRGEVRFMAVPAEEMAEVGWRMGRRAAGEIEFLTGKPEFIRSGLFDDVDAAMLTHTSIGSGDGLASVGDTHNGASLRSARFRGRATAAGATPWEGVNALKAATLAIAAIDAQRETFRDADTVRIQTVIEPREPAVSVVPDDVRLDTMIRAADDATVDRVGELVDRCVRAGAMATGAGVRIERMHGYLAQAMHPTLVEIVARNLVDLLGASSVGTPSHSSGSTDLGDLGALLPVVQPRAGGVVGSPHSADYLVVDHVTAAVVPAKSMAMSVVDLMGDDARGAEGLRRSWRPRLDRSDYLERIRARFTVDDLDGASLSG